MEEQIESQEENPQKTPRKTTERDPEDLKLLTNRLNRIEGQIKGIRGMLERNAYCPDILIQVSAVNAALHSFNRMLIENHMHACVVKEIQDGSTESLDEFIKIFPKIMQ